MDAAPITFHSELLKLSFTYPGSLTAQKLPSPEEQHAETAKKQPADEPEEYRRADQCTDLALGALRKDDPNQPVGFKVYGEGHKPRTVLEFPVEASLEIMRVGLDCMPKKYLTDLDALAGVTAKAATDAQGMQPIDQPVWFEVGKTKVHIAAVESTDKKAPAYAVAAVFVSNGSLVTMTFESTDLEFLNEMLHGTIAVGNEPALPLLPAGTGIGRGEPIKPKP